MSATLDVTAIGNAIVDVIAPVTPDFLAHQGLVPGSMSLINEARATELYALMAAGVETSGGSAANTVAGVASLGGKAAFIGKVGADELGKIFAHDIRAVGARFETAPLVNGPATARCLVKVTPDGQRTMSTFLGACVELTAADIDPELIERAQIVYLEGYLFDPPGAREAFSKAASVARAGGRRLALSLSDSFVVDRHRAALLAFIETRVDILFANTEELCALFETTDAEAAQKAIRGRVEIAAITCGAGGSVILTAGEALAVPADPVSAVIDTTGAGDQFAAGFLYALARSRDLGACGALGSMAAAEVISHYGPRPVQSLAQRALTQGLLAA